MYYIKKLKMIKLKMNNCGFYNAWAKFFLALCLIITACKVDAGSAEKPINLSPSEIGQAHSLIGRDLEQDVEKDGSMSIIEFFDTQSFSITLNSKKIWVVPLSFLPKTYPSKICGLAIVNPQGGASKLNIVLSDSSGVSACVGVLAISFSDVNGDSYPDAILMLLVATGGNPQEREPAIAIWNPKTEVFVLDQERSSFVQERETKTIAETKKALRNFPKNSR